jgi:hypothetical protein
LVATTALRSCEGDDASSERQRRKERRQLHGR